MAFDPVSFAMGAKGSGGGGGSGGMTICPCTYEDGTITSTMTAAEMWSACQSGSVAIQYSIEEDGTTFNKIDAVTCALVAVGANDTIIGYRFTSISGDLQAESGSDYPTGGGK